MDNSITVNKDGKCYTLSNDHKVLIKYHWHDGKEMTIPTEVESIGPFALANFKHINTIYIPRGIKKVGYGAFCECSSLKTVLFQDVDQEIIVERRAFWKCYSLENINLPNQVTIIPEGCFEDCYNLQQILLPKGLKCIEKYPFKGCKNLSSIFIGSNVNSISPNSFDFTENLNSIIVHKDNLKFSSIAGILLEGQTLIRVPEAFDCRSENPRKTNSLLANVMQKCSAIGEGAFRNTNITLMLIPKNIRGIYYRAFECCQSLKVIYFQEGCCIDYIGMKTFANCPNLQVIQIPDGVSIIGAYAFENCSSLKTVYIPASVWRIKQTAFVGCDILKAIIFPSIKSNKVRHMEENTCLLLPNDTCNISVPMEELDYFRKIFKAYQNAIKTHRF